MRSFIYAFVVYLCAFLVGQVVHAAPVNVSPVSVAVLDALPAIALVGGASLLIWVMYGAFGAVREVMGASLAADTSRDLAPHVCGYVDQQSYLDALASRLAAEDAANGVEWRDVGTGKSNLDYEREAVLRDWDVGSSSLRAEAEASGSDMALYDKYVADDATHSEAMRWSNKEANAEVKMPVLGPGWK